MHVTGCLAVHVTTCRLPPCPRSPCPRAEQVIDAFSVPHVGYDPVRKLFHRSSEPPRLQADAAVSRAGCGLIWRGAA